MSRHSRHSRATHSGRPRAYGSVDEGTPEGAAQARRRAARELRGVERLPDAQEARDPDPAQRLELPAREGRPDEREPRALALAPEDQLGQRAPGEVRG